MKYEGDSSQMVNECVVVDGILNPCKSLDNALEGTGRKKGISILEVYNFQEKRVSKTIAVLRSGDFLKNGVVVNYCPFCGQSIAGHVV